MNVRAAILCVLALAPPGRVFGQTVNVDVSQTVGYSTDDVTAAATQVRGFGELKSGVRFMAEASWAGRRMSTSTESDVFGAAYPYENRVALIEAFAERTFQPGPFLVSTRGGRYRTPFGISSGSDHAYTGFLRAPLIRYGDYFALSNTFLEHGADVVVGIPRLTLEVSLGTPADVGEVSRRAGLDTVVRAQAAIGSLIVGLSHSNTNPYQPERYAHGRAAFTGVDARWMRGGVQVRGEWIAGQPFDGTTTDGGYADLILHRPAMGPVTAVLRAERLAYDAAPPHALFAQRYTAGARIRLFERLAAQVGVVHQRGGTLEEHPHAFDVGLTYSVRGW